MQDGQLAGRCRVAGVHGGWVVYRGVPRLPCPTLVYLPTPPCTTLPYTSQYTCGSCTASSTVVYTVRAVLGAGLSPGPLQGLVFLMG